MTPEEIKELVLKNRDLEFSEFIELLQSIDEKNEGFVIEEYDCAIEIDFDGIPCFKLFISIGFTIVKCNILFSKHFVDKALWRISKILLKTPYQFLSGKLIVNNYFFHYNSSGSRYTYYRLILNSASVR